MVAINRYYSNDPRYRTTAQKSISEDPPATALVCQRKGTVAKDAKPTVRRVLECTPPRGVSIREKLEGTVPPEPASRRKRTRPLTPGESFIAHQRANKPRGPGMTQMTGPDNGPASKAQGTTNRRLMSPSACVDFHAFAETLGKWETGVPVDCGDPWEWDTVVAAVEQGAHKSATSPESISLVEDDVAYQVASGCATGMPWEELCRLRPTNLKISPLAVVPQRNRRGRMILDLSVAVRRRLRGRKRRQLARQQM